MALKLYNESDIQDIADAIRGKNGSSDTYKVSQMAAAIGNIPSGGGTWDFFDLSTPSGTLSADFTTFPTWGDRYLFSGRTGIDTISLPNLTTITISTFYNAFAKHIYIPKANNGNYDATAFDKCVNLESIALPSVTNSIGTAYFRDCPNLEAVDLNIRSFFQQNHFQNDAKLATLVLRKSGVVPLGDITTFAGTPFASGGTGGTLYVPASQISSYQSATNWSTILGYTNNQIKSIESTHTDPDAPIDLTTHYADGTLISS